MTTLLLGFSKEIDFYLRGTPCAFGPCENIAERFATWADEVKEVKPDLLVINVHALFRQYSFAGDYEGVEVLKHLRLTDLGPLRSCHVVLVSWDSPDEIIKRNPGNAIIFSSGVTVVHTTEIIELLADSNRLQSLAGCRATLSDDYLSASVRADYKPPDSAHQMSNWWGAWRLIQTIKKDNPTMPSLVREKMSLLETKQALFLADASDKPGKVDNTKIKRLQNIVQESAPLICYVDDEADKGWEEAFRTLLYGANGCGRFRPLGREFLLAQEPIEKPIKDKLPEIAKVILGLAPNLLILDLRLEGGDEASKPPKDASGARLLEEIRKKDKGLPILLMTASNKARMLQDIMKLGADAYWMKEGIGEHAPLDSREKPAHELIRLLSALLGEDWQFLLRFQSVQETLRVASERLQCWWTQEKQWIKEVDWPANDRGVRNRITAKKAPGRTSLTAEGISKLLDILAETAALYREYLSQDLFAYQGEPRSLASKDLWLRGIAIHAARMIEGVHRFDQIENGAGKNHKKMIPELVKERGDMIGQEIIYHRNGAAHYKPQGQFDEGRTRDLLRLLCAWLRLDPLDPPYKFGVRGDGPGDPNQEDWDPEYRLRNSLERYPLFKQSPINKLSLMMFEELPWRDEHACAQLLASNTLATFRATAGKQIAAEVLLNIVSLEDGKRAALALQCLQPVAQAPNIQSALQKRWRDRNAPSQLKCHLIWRIADYSGLTEEFKTELRSWIIDNFEAWTESAQDFFSATPKSILEAIRKKLEPPSIYPEHKKWILICCTPITSEREVARQLLSLLESPDGFVEATKVEILERFFRDQAQAAG